MRVNKKTLAGVFVWISLALIMVRDIGLIKSNINDFIGGFFLGLVISYKITAYLFGWAMPALTWLEKGEHDFIRFILFVFCVVLWLVLLFRP